MSFGRTKESIDICSKLFLSGDAAETSKIFLINGPFGTGKSMLTENVKKMIDDSGKTDCLIYCNDFQSTGFLPDLMYELLGNAVFYTHDEKFTPHETAYNRNNFLENLVQLKENKSVLFNDYVRESLLKSHGDFILTKYLSDGDSDVNDAIINFFEKKADSTLLINSGNITAESFIVDLMNYFYSPDENNSDYNELIEKSEPKKVIIILDDYEPVAGSLISWLFNSFFSYCYDTVFGDFEYYDVSFINPRTKISRCLDFRFVLAGREDYYRHRDIIGKTGLEKLIYQTGIGPFNSQDTAEFIKEKKNGLDFSLENVMKITLGLPFIIQLWIESNDLKSDKFDNLIYHVVIQRLFRYKNEYEKEWIKCASYLETVTEEALKCFPGIGANNKKAFQYFINSNELTEYDRETDNYRIRPHIAVYVKKAEAIESPKMALEHKNIAEIYNAKWNLCRDLSDKENEVARNIAYFKNFDRNFALEKAFQSDVSLAKGFIDKYLDWFEKNEHTLKMKDDIKKKLMDFNKLYDCRKFDEKHELIRGIWDEFKVSAEEKKKEKRSEIENLELEKSEVENEIKEKKKEHTNLQVQFMEAENELIELRVTIGEYSANKHLYTAVSNFSIGILLAVLAFFLLDIFDGYPNISQFEMIRDILYGVAMLFGGVGVFFFFKMIFSKSKKEFEVMNEGLEMKIQMKDQMQADMNRLREEYESAGAKLGRLNEAIGKLKDEIAYEQAKLHEEFI